MPIAEWQAEVEAQSGGIVVIVRVETDPGQNVLRIPPNFPGRSVVAGLLQQETFVAQLVRAHALTVNYSGTEGTFHFILLNMALAPDWEGMEDSLLAHELGHVWLHANGYRAVDSEVSCLATHAGDIVQHVLIREETRRRGFDYMRFWTRSQEKWLLAQENSDAVIVLEGCRALQLISAWMDAELGLTETQWPLRERYLRLLRVRFSDFTPVVTDLRTLLAGLDLWDRSLYEFALGKVVERLRPLVP